MDTNGARHRLTPATPTPTTTTRKPPATIADPAPGPTKITVETTPQTLATASSTPRGTPRFSGDAFADERDDVLSVINELEDQLDRYEAVRANLERELAESRTELATVRQRLRETEWQTAAAQTRIEVLEQVRGDMALLEEELTDANVRTQRASEQFARAQADNTRLTQELKSAHQQLDELLIVRKERDSLRGETRTLRARLEQIERTQNEMIAERTGLHGRIEDLRSTAEAQRAARITVDAELRGMQERLNETVRARQELAETLESLRNEKKGLQVQLTHFERENARLAEQQKITESEAATLRSINHGAESALTNVKKAFTEVRAALSETRLRARRRPIETRLRGTPTVPAGVSGDELLTEVNEAMRWQTERSTTSAAMNGFSEQED